MTFGALFPGQGSQSVKMLADFGSDCSEFVDTFSEASEALGYNLWALAQDGPAEKLSLTEITQPLMLTAGVALFRLWIARGGTSPKYMAGHSLGEYTAFTAAGSLQLADAVKVVRARGRFMQEAVPEGTGAMAAVIGLSDSAIESICTNISLEMQCVIEAVNYNAPDQLVVAGHVSAIEASISLFKKAGAKRALMLPVSAPFHCSLMKPAADRLEEFLDVVSIKAPDVPVIQSVSLEPETDVHRIKKHLVSQIFSPIRWSQILQGLSRLHVVVAAEFGPGNVLCGLAKRNKVPTTHLPLGTLSQFNVALSSGSN